MPSDVPLVTVIPSRRHNNAHSSSPSSSSPSVSLICMPCPETRRWANTKYRQCTSGSPSLITYSKRKRCLLVEHQQLKPSSLPAERNGRVGMSICCISHGRRTILSLVGRFDGVSDSSVMTCTSWGAKSRLARGTIREIIMSIEEARRYREGSSPCYMRPRCNTLT